MRKSGFALGLAALVLGLMNSPALAQKRVALLVGNNAYQNVPVLRTAVNDAHALADALGKLNFSVVIAESAIAVASIVLFRQGKWKRQKI